MGARDDLAVVKRWFHLLATGDYDAMHALQTKDVVWDVIAGPHEGLVPWLGVFKGRKGVTRCLDKFAGAVESESFDLADFLTGPKGRVAVTGRTRLKERRTGRRMHIDFVEYFRLRRGKIFYVRVYGDSATAAAAFRAMKQRPRRRRPR